MMELSARSEPFSADKAIPEAAEAQDATDWHSARAAERCCLNACLS